MIQGTIIRVAGPVVDVQFTAGRLPALQEALTVTAEGTERTMEVTQHVNETTVRCIMLSASEGLGKGMPVEATGHGLTAPVGEGTLGRMFDPLGRPIDGKGAVDELRAKGDEVSYEEILQNVLSRDKADMTRAISPLRKADDAVVLDNSCMTVAEQMEWFEKEFRRAIGDGR